MTWAWSSSSSTMRRLDLTVWVSAIGTDNLTTKARRHEGRGNGAKPKRDGERGARIRCMVGVVMGGHPGGGRGGWSRRVGGGRGRRGRPGRHYRRGVGGGRR